MEQVGIEIQRLGDDCGDRRAGSSSASNLQEYSSRSAGSFDEKLYLVEKISWPGIDIGDLCHASRSFCKGNSEPEILGMVV